MMKIDSNSKLKPYYNYALIGGDLYESSKELQSRNFRDSLPLGTIYACFGSTPSTPSDYDITIFKKQFEIETVENYDEFLFNDYDEEAFQMLFTPGKLIEKLKELQQ